MSVPNPPNDGRLVRSVVFGLLQCNWRRSRLLPAKESASRPRNRGYTTCIKCGKLGQQGCVLCS
eukprot:337424-Amphidinium_carterae.1